MYKVRYYTFARCGDDSIGNILQYSDTWNTENFIEDIPKALGHVVDARKGAEKYIPVIKNIENIKGHL